MPSIRLSFPRHRRGCVRYSNRVKVLLCYLVAFAVPPLWLLAGLFWVYPYYLAGSAPTVAANLTAAFPMLEGLLSGAVATAGDPVTLSAAAWADALNSRQQQWMFFLMAVFALAWLMTLCIQLIWRIAHAKPYQVARGTLRAIRHYRLSMLVIAFVNLAFAFAVWLLGVRFIAGRTAWDYLVYFAPYALNVVGALCCFRLAAPPVISGKHAFFKRL